MAEAPLNVLAVVGSLNRNSVTRVVVNFVGEKLRTAGIDIARRTIAKYREAMRIPSSVQRRRDKHVASGTAP